jgi:hypothetical protein
MPAREASSLAAQARVVGAGERVRVAPGRRAIWDEAALNAEGRRGAWVDYPVSETLLDRMLDDGRIGGDEFRAGLRFQAVFAYAGLTARPVTTQPDPIKIDGGKWREPIGGSLDALAEIEAALDHVGPYGGLVLTWMLGHGETVEAFVWRCRSSGLTTGPGHVQHILRVALGALVAFYDRRARA